MRSTKGFGLTVVALAAVLAVSGCGAVGDAGRDAESASGATPAPSSPGTVSSTPDQPGAGGSAGTPIGACPAAAMTGRVTTPDAAAGSRYAELIVTNTGGQPCDATGFLDLLLLDGRGRALPTDVRHEGPQLRNIVLLPPGGHAYSRIHWGVVPGEGDATDGPCQPNPATIAVTMPNDTERFRVPWDLGAVCQSGRIDTQALRTGLPPAGYARPGD